MIFEDCVVKYAEEVPCATMAEWILSDGRLVTMGPGTDHRSIAVCTDSDNFLDAISKHKAISVRMSGDWISIRAHETGATNQQKALVRELIQNGAKSLAVDLYSDDAERVLSRVFYSGEIQDGILMLTDPIAYSATLPYE